MSAKPVLGVTTAGVVQGAPVQMEDTEGTEELHCKASIVQGLAEAAMATIATNTVAAAGLAMAAAHVAEAMPTGSGPGAAPNEIASGFASSALDAAKAGSPEAAGLTDAAISAAIAVAEARSKSSAEIQAAISARLSSKCETRSKSNAGYPQSRIAPRSSIKSNASYSEIFASMFKADFQNA